MPKTYEGFWLTVKAEIDLEDIWDYGAETWSPNIAEAYYDEIILGLEKLLAGLKHGQDVGFVRNGYFRVKAGRHHIYYKENGNIIEVIRILHECMNPSLYL